MRLRRRVQRAAGTNLCERGNLPRLGGGRNLRRWPLPVHADRRRVLGRLRDIDWQVRIVRQQLLGAGRHRVLGRESAHLRNGRAWMLVAHRMGELPVGALRELDPLR